MDGIFFTLLCSVFAAFYYITNDIFKMRGDAFVFCRSVVAAVIMLPFVPFLAWDAGLYAYITIILANIFYAFGDMAVFNATKKYSASSMSRVLISRNMILFILWPVLIAGYWDRLSSQPLVLGAAFLLITLTTWAMYHQKKTEIGAAVIKAALPALLFATLGDLFTAFILYGRPNLNLMCEIMFVASITLVVVSGVRVMHASHQAGTNLFIVPHWKKAALINGILLICTAMTKTMGMAYLENPGYFGAMVMVYTVWLYLLHKYWLKRQEVVDPRLGFVVVLCSMALGVLSLYIPK